MHVLTYIVSDEKLEAELEWLDGQHIYPAKERWFDYDNWDKVYWQLGMIVNSDDELAIKLRVSKIHSCNEWKRK